MVTIDRVYLQGENERVVLLDEPVTTDLAALVNTADLLVDDHVVSDGVYAQLRLVIGGAAVSLRRDGGLEVYATPGYPNLPDGTSAGDLTIPSWSSSGFKVKAPDGALEVEGEQRLLLVDFDIAESVGQETGAGDLVMRPVIDAIDLELSATIELDVSFGAIDPAMVEGTAAILRDVGGNIEARTLLELDGDPGTATATFRFLRPDEGPFSLAFEPVDGVAALHTSPTLPTEIGVSSGRITAIALTVDSVVLE